jgi:hypothetical protein
MKSWMLGAPFAVIGLVLVCVAVYIFAGDGAMKSWPTADGVITSSTIDATWTQAKDNAGRPRPYESCTPNVHYTYTADGKQLEGRRITREPFASSRAEIETWVRRYPVGKAVKVYYDPKDPTSSILEFKTSIAGVIVGALGGFFLLFGVALMVAIAFLLKPAPPHPV